jgi:hypothetical protein
VPRKVITAALIGSLVCGLLLVIALGCAFKLYSLRTQEYRWAPRGGLEPQFFRFPGERSHYIPGYGLGRPDTGRLFLCVHAGVWMEGWGSPDPALCYPIMLPFCPLLSGPLRPK